MVSKPKRPQYGSCHGSRGGYQALNAGAPFRVQKIHVGFLMDQAALGQVYL